MLGGLAFSFWLGLEEKRDKIGCYVSNRINTPFSDQFMRQCMQFGNSAGNFESSAFRRPFGHDSTAVLSKKSCTFNQIICRLSIIGRKKVHIDVKNRII